MKETIVVSLNLSSSWQSIRPSYPKIPKLLAKHIGLVISQISIPITFFQSFEKELAI